MAAVRDLIAGMGLDLVEAHEPGEQLTYHVAVVAAQVLIPRGVRESRNRDTRCLVPCSRHKGLASV